jgi:hypothetical protein
MHSMIGAGGRALTGLAGGSVHIVSGVASDRDLGVRTGLILTAFVVQGDVICN